MYVMEARLKKIALEEMGKIWDVDGVQDAEKMLGDMFQITQEESPSHFSFETFKTPPKLRAYLKDQHDFDVTPKHEASIKACWDSSTGPTIEDRYRNFLRLWNKKIFAPFEEK